jgi:hypothetical protein
LLPLLLLADALLQLHKTDSVHQPTATEFAPAWPKGMNCI